LNLFIRKSIPWNSVIIGATLIACEAGILAHGILKELEDGKIDNWPAY
jgi:hypothetical protein